MITVKNITGTMELLVKVSNVVKYWFILSSTDLFQGTQITTQNNRVLMIKKTFFLVQTLADCPAEEKETKIRSIQLLHAQELFNSKEYDKSMKEFFKLNTDPAVVIKLFPELDNKSDSDSKLKGKDLENAFNALIHYLLESRAKIGKSAAEGSQEEGASQRNVTQQLELIDTTLLKCYLQVCSISLLNTSNRYTYIHAVRCPVGRGGT